MTQEVPKVTIALPSAQSLLLQLGVGDHAFSTATGFVMDSVQGPVLITNRHNVTGRRQDTNKPISPTGAIPDRININHNSSQKFGVWIWRFEQLYADGKPRWIEHPELTSEADFVALPLTSLTGVQLYPYRFTPDDEPRILCAPSEMVSVIGFPFGMQAGRSLAVWAAGFVASEPDINYNNLPIFLIDSRSRPGQSGSAVIAYRPAGSAIRTSEDTGFNSEPIWQLLGIYSGRINDQSDLGLVWKVDAIKELIDSIH